MIRDKTLEAITQKVKLSNYYSVIMDCMPEALHIEQLSVTLRTVTFQVGVRAAVDEHFVGFLAMTDTSGAGLTDVLLNCMGTLGLEISKCRE